MVERLESGKQSKDAFEKSLMGRREFSWHGTPTVPLKRYAREILRNEADPKLAEAVVEFAEANYWIENKIGNPEKHQTRAVRRAKIFGFSEQEVAAISQSAATIYMDYKKFAGVNQDNPLTRRSIAEAKTKKEAKAKLKKELESKYKNLMMYSDTILQIENSNQRIKLNEYPVFANSGITIKEKMKKRKLPGRQYKKLQERQGKRLEKSEDPYERVKPILFLESNNPISTEKLTQLLRSDDELIRQAAADALDQGKWKPKTPTELTFYLIAKNEWDKVIILGDDALPALLKSARSQDVLIRDKAVEILEEHEWQSENLSPHDQAAYYLLKGEFSRFEQLLNDNERLLSVAWEFLNDLNGVNRERICLLLEKIDTPKALQVLSRFKEDNYMIVRIVASNALIRLSENPFYLQKLTGTLSNVKVPVVRAILSVHPEWKGKHISKQEVDRFTNAILYLPPVGGKIIKESAGRNLTNQLDPSLIVEEQIAIINSLRQREELGKVYMHQLTVQGRLSDEFKYVALALILNSPYSNDWAQPLFSTIWGTVAPLVHDGGRVQTHLNPSWGKVQGRTDFLQRTVPVHPTNLEELEKLKPEEQAKQPIDTLVNARNEQEERERLTVEGKAYQRLALALHAKEGTAPDSIPEDIKQSLANYWQDFIARMNMLLGEYAIKRVIQVPWFNKEPQKLKGWEVYGLRHEAEWQPIQKELILLEQARGQYPELRQQVRHFLIQITNAIDREIGLLPKTN